MAPGEAEGWVAANAGLNSTALAVKHQHEASLHIDPYTSCRQEIIKCTLHAYIDVISACSSLQTFD